MAVDGAVDHGHQITTGHSDEPAIEVAPEQLSRKAPYPSRILVHQPQLLYRISCGVQFGGKSHPFGNGVPAAQKSTT